MILLLLPKYLLAVYIFSKQFRPSMDHIRRRYNSLFHRGVKHHWYVEEKNQPTTFGASLPNQCELNTPLTQY